MDWARLRNRNALAERRMVGDPGYGDLPLLTAEMNRLEQSMMGVYPMTNGVPPNNHLVQEAARATGLSQRSVSKVLRWFLCLPEPGCKECEETVKRVGEDKVNQRCNRHLGYEWT